MDRATEREALRLLETHRAFVRAAVVGTVGSVPGKLGATMIVREDGTTMGTVGGAALEEEVKKAAGRAIGQRRGELLHFDLAAWKPRGLPSLCGGSVDVAIEYVAARPNVLFWGGGHVTLAVARLLRPLEIDHSVADDRPDFLGPERFPDADRRERVEASELFRTFEPSAFSHLLVMGYDSVRDTEVLYQATRQFPNTIGLIASAPKREHIFDRLRQRGVPREVVGRIRSPVGLPIGAETPAEIAVSIVAEIVRDLRPEASVIPPRASGAVAAEGHVERSRG